MNNFTYLTKEKQFESFSQACVEAEKSMMISYATTAILARRALEVAIEWVFKNDSELNLPHQDHLNALINHKTFTKIIHKKLYPMLTYIQKLGNKAAHTTKPITREQATLALRNLYEFTLWINYSYSKKVYHAPFNAQILTDSENQPRSQEELKKLCEILHHKEQPLVKKEDEKIREENALNREINNQNREFIVNESPEFQTRKLYVQLELELSGWDFGRNCIEDVKLANTYSPIEFVYVDYVLYGDSGTPLAIIEARKTSKDHQAGQKQAQDYADYFEVEVGFRPIIFYTDGFEYYLWDEENDDERILSGIYTKDELEWFIDKQNNKQSLNNAHMGDQISNRYYQKMALNAICQTFEQGKRKALVVMAAGAGKTRVAISVINILMNYGWAKHILYLADREELVNQARTTVETWLPDVSICNLLNRKDDPNSDVVFSTYRAMIKAIDAIKNEDGQQLFSNGHFDLIIIDESHRSIYKKHHIIFDYFDAILLGLTATPKNEIDKQSYKVFKLKYHEPTFAYELTDAVADGYLLPYHTIETKFKFLEEGIHYDQLSEEDKEEFEETFEEDVHEISSEELNSFLFNANTVDTVINDIMTKGIKVNENQTLGKTIIFAKNKDHANYIINRFNQLYPQYNGEFARVIYAGIKGVNSMFKQFKDKNQWPQIAVSVEMLDTGIDIPELVNLVFFKKVQSKEKFWQMIGRGTRRCKELLGPGRDKDSFRVFDYCSNFEYFRGNKNTKDVTIRKTLNETLFSIKVRIFQALLTSNINSEGIQAYKNTLMNELVKKIQAIVPNKFNIRMQMKYIDKYKRESEFEQLTMDDVDRLEEHIAPFVSDEDKNTLAKKFDYLMYTIEYGMLKDIKTDKAKQKVMTVAKKLSTKGNIEQIKQQELLLLAVQTSTYWETADVIDCETVRVALRELIQFIDFSDSLTYYTDFADEVLEVKISF